MLELRKVETARGHTSNVTRGGEEFGGRIGVKWGLTINDVFTRSFAIGVTNGVNTAPNGINNSTSTSLSLSLPSNGS